MNDNQLKHLMKSNRMTIMDGVALGIGIMIAPLLIAFLIWLVIESMGITLKEVI